jgi:DNA polymerase-3 subunit delta'
MPFSQIQGQSDALMALQRAYAQNRLHHAYLFYGPDGIGKRKSAFALASLLLCKSKIYSDLQGYDSCGQCGGCIRLQAGTHPDFIYIERALNSKGVPGQAIKINQIREMQKKLSYQAYEGGRRVICIEEADRLNLATANALLKTLEEPGVDTHFILLTHRVNLILPTISSRCQKVRFTPLPLAVMIDLIAQHTSLDQAPDQHTLAQLSGGSIGHALHYEKQDLLTQAPTLISNIDRDLTLKELDSLWQVVDQYEKLSEIEIKSLFHLLRTWYRDLMVVQNQGDQRLLTHVRAYSHLKTRSAQLTLTRLKWRILALNEAERHLFDRVGSNKRLILETLFLYLSGQDQTLGHTLRFK